MLSRRKMMAISASALMAPTAPGASTMLDVVATTGMIADTVRRIGGAQVTVTGLMGPGTDPHSYRQTRSDIVALTRADVILWNGLFLEAQLQDVLLRLASRKPVIAVTDRLDTSALLAHADYAGAHDPHVWMDPGLWSQVAARIAGALSDLLPQGAGTFAAGFEAFDADCAALSSYGASVLAEVPADRRVLVTAHDAFSYFGRAFGLEVLGVQGISTNSEAGLHRIRDLVAVLVERGIEAVFVESSVSDRNIRALIEGAEAAGHKVRLGGQLYSDAMGPAGTYEGTYQGMMDHNITTIARALGADVPAEGLLGRLSAGG